MRKLKRYLKLALRRVADVANGTAFRWVRRKVADLQAFPHYIELVQPIMPSSMVENKIHNITLAADRLHLLLWEPGAILSFWQLIGEASEQRGYKEGRNIIGGKLQKDFGGGLCQLSSILYHLALLGSLRIVERHHHSVDFYKEDERFTPLGSDATVVYGYKDLRLENSLQTPLVVWLRVEGNTLTARFYAAEPITPMNIAFERQYVGDSVSVSAVDAAGRVVSTSRYVLQH
ncbi:MAG: VanW family protein [Gammaproteobacteria bacterium]|nr:VanW family protein [Gammaproteobacteria bacterium]MBU1723699.1 VanW family protein [Gammaproteobacteria bacterium]MBU2004783.1 VanW family protein [Gammaproteobacteria bacterium]